MKQYARNPTTKNDNDRNTDDDDNGSKMFQQQYTGVVVINDDDNDDEHHHSQPSKNHMKATIALCCAVLSVSYMLISVFPYSGYMSIQLLQQQQQEEGTTTTKMIINEENVGLYAGFMASSFMIGRAISSYGWGITADIYGRIPCLLLSLLLSSLLSLGFGCSTSYTAAIVWRFTMGLVNGVLPISKTLITELAYGDRTLETRGMGLVMGMWSWGFLISPAIAGITSDPIKQYPHSHLWLSSLPNEEQATWYYKLLKKFPFLLPNLIGTIFGVIAFIAVWMYVPETLPKEHVVAFQNIPGQIWCSMKRALSTIPEETSIQIKEALSFVSTSTTKSNSENTQLSIDRRKYYGDTRYEGVGQQDREDNKNGDNYVNDDGDITTSILESEMDALFPDLDDEDMDDAIRKARASYDEHSILLATTLLRDSSRRSITASIRKHSTVLSQRRRQSRLSSWKIASSRIDTTTQVTSLDRNNTPMIPPTTTTATLSSLWSQASTRNHMIVFWLSSFVSTTVDEGFPLFCISKLGGLSLSEKTIGKILSLCGLLFAIAQYTVFTSLVTTFGLYGAIRISSSWMGPLIMLIPISIWLNRPHSNDDDTTTTTGRQDDYINTLTFIYISVVLASYRICGLAFMSSLTIGLNRTVIPSHRGAMNGLVAVGGSVARAIGPIFSGILITFSLSSSYIPAQIGGFVLFSVIGILGMIVASLTYFIIHDDDDDDS